MKKEDIKFGNVVELRDGDKYIYSIESTMLNLNGGRILSKTQYNELLIRNGNHDWDIMKVYEDYTLKKVLWERKEKPKLTEDEKAILRNLPKKWKYIVRDEDGCLWMFDDYKPHKGKTSPQWFGNIGEPLILFNHLFQFITWENEEPYLISDLLGEDK